MRVFVITFFAAASLLATPTAAADGGTDAGDGGATDGGTDAGDGGAIVDAGDGGSDAGPGDGGATDASTSDAGDAGLDGGYDAGFDGGYDAGPVDGGYDAGYDAGPKYPEGTGAFCQTATPNCLGNLICAPYPDYPEYGNCRLPCDDSDGSDSACLRGDTCQTIVDPVSLGELFSVCQPQLTRRDQSCLAPLDQDACTDERECLVTRPTGDVSMNCKETCDLSLPATADAGCATGERCFNSTVVQDVQVDGAGNTVQCTLSLCDGNNPPACECDEGAGFSCVLTSTGTSVCGLVPGLCGVPVPGLVLDDLTDAGFIPYERLCNSAEASRFCDNSEYEGLDNPGANVCAFEGQLSDFSSDGLCLPFCGNSTFDDDNDGVIEPGEVEPRFDCPDGQVCTRRLSRELLFGPGPPDLFGPFGVKGCDPVACPAGQPCADCGPGEVECLVIPEELEVNAAGVCIAPMRTCDRPPPGYDDGPNFDAGPPPVLDAGPSDAGFDAGYDAGAPPTGPRLGEDNNDGIGPAGAGPCACSHADDRQATGGAGALALLGVIALLRRRRRA
jgi:MYXO-CTERM domain-containing protein